MQRGKKPQAVTELSSSLILRILNAVFLGGIIEEFALIIKNGIGTIASLDKTTCLFAFARGAVGNIPDASLGIKDGGFLTKAITATGAEKIVYSIEDDKWFVLNLPNIGDIKLLLTAPEMIPTSVLNYEEPVQKIKASAPIKVALTKDGCERFLCFQNLVKNDSTMITVKETDVFIGSGKYETKTFVVKVGQIEKPMEQKDFSATVLCEHLTAVLLSLDWVNGLPPVMNIGVNAPVLITQGDFFWSLNQSFEK